MSICGDLSSFHLSLCHWSVHRCSVEGQHLREGSLLVIIWRQQQQRRRLVAGGRASQQTQGQATQTIWLARPLDRANR